MAEARSFAERQGRPFRMGVTSGLQALPAWKQEADFLLAQVSFSYDDLLTWRDGVDFRGPVYAGVMVIASAPMARKLSLDIPQLAVPPGVVDRLDQDGSAGLSIACDLVERVRASGTFDGVHLIPVGRYREVASRLEASLAAPTYRR